MNIEVKILRNENGKPAGKLADAEIHFIAGELAGLKLVGFGIWEARANSGRSRSVTFPARQFVVHGDKRNFALLRAIDDPSVLARVAFSRLARARSMISSMPTEVRRRFLAPASCREMASTECRA